MDWLHILLSHARLLNSLCKIVVFATDVMTVIKCRMGKPIKIYFCLRGSFSSGVALYIWYLYSSFSLTFSLCGCLALLPVCHWQQRSSDLSGCDWEAARWGSGTADRWGHCGMFEILLQWICPAPSLSAPTQALFSRLQPGTSPPLTPHTHFILSALLVEPAQSCQSASLCQPNYHTHLKGVKSSSELPGVAFPVWA